MKTMPVTDSMKDAIVAELGQSPLFHDLSPDDLTDIAKSATIVQCEENETVMVQGDPSDCFYLVASGEVAVQVRDPARDKPVEIARVKPYETVGELGLLLDQPRSATVATTQTSHLLRFDHDFFNSVFVRFPSFGLTTCRVLGQRLLRTAQHVGAPAAEPMEKAATMGTEAAAETETSLTCRSPRLYQFLRRMLAERASDLHLSGGHRPRWRIDGDMLEIKDTSVLGPEDVLELVKPIMPSRNLEQFLQDNDTDFASALPGASRFRVNVFRDHRGVGTVMRQIPEKILSIDQLGLPAVVRQLCDYPKGLVLVTGPTGSGKSTTLAAMVDHINRTRTSHIITLEDPVEFVHVSQKCLVNQREVGPHTTSFARALRAALREDPDIVLVGEMRDLETVALALETANTGHLVFATLHTNTAVSTLNRIIDMFPAEQQNQVRAVLADTLKGVVAQTLCRRVGKGRIAALEILVSDTGISNLIREGKTQQMMSAMQTGKSRGNRILNEELLRLVKEKLITQEEAMSKTVDKPDMASKLGIKQAGEGG